MGKNVDTRSFDGSSTKPAKGVPKLSGSEEPFTNFVYGTDRWGKKQNNCYAFAIDYFKGNMNKKLQMGELAKTLKPSDDLTDPKTLKQRTLEDLGTKKNGGYAAGPCEKCKKGFYKIIAFTHPGNDYHWLRQMGDMLITSDGKKTVANIAKEIGVDKSQIDAPSSNKPKKGEPILIKNAGLFAHKRGFAELTVLDASGKFITDPRKANLNYGDINYKTFAGAFCVNVNFGSGGRFSCVNT
ncbi:hypothetical protein NY2A_B177R [Paramecium bursaria Chlorella virus NY2A]|uniref:Uncharacterized protein B177R n=1 Tax=Paramecium bursaria Chlorella virus NY2A TaxID=46021 RepID=A7IW52_PBCVN|nr:hypothetical protein NY2A_B177R [Paramecium bursaria Chlorella virus NY2A]ABT14576.1 hypothetical protein NY2A_B177R [Paramecium bursaria Chlorella virus NY2A]